MYQSQTLLFGLPILGLIPLWFAFLCFTLAAAVKHWRAGGKSRFIDWSVGLTCQALIVVIIAIVLFEMAWGADLVIPYALFLISNGLIGYAIREEKIRDVRLHKTYWVRFSRNSWEWWYSNAVLILIGVIILLAIMAFLISKGR